ncbi:MAG TPA: phosphomannomutase/phosphoglucomutase [Nitrospirae bacterium]|nr:phosphomannomutase/phosphoglucomutase [bacterium BMS3Bbin08]HDK17322.1 phosphomannomutase/phosphoglucomutase [Nitrospirota bacterium]
MGDIFKAYDIRGSYPDELDEALAGKIGTAFADMLNARRIVIGRDIRLSSLSLAKAFIEGAATSGVSVTDIGLTTTPMLYYAIIDGKFDGGAMVTASHLPGQFNGFKLCREEAIPLSGDHGLPALKKLVMKGLPAGRGHAYMDSCEALSVQDKYIDKLNTFVHNPGPLKIVVDAGNGMAGLDAPVLLKRFPVWEFTPMYMEPDGNFPHHVANPLLPSATRELQSMVLKERADIGVAFDGDADRCGFIDEKGERIPADLVTALIAGFLLTKEPGATILYDLRSGRIVPETITRLGGKAIRCRVGHAFIKAQMREENALFAGELSGHYYYRDMGFTDNGVLSMIHILNLLSLKNSPLSDLIRPLKKYYSTGELNMQTKYKEAIFAALEAKYKDAGKDHLDGLRVEYSEWWFNLRASNTEPVIRLNLEADNKQIMEEKRNEILKIIMETDPKVILKPQA